MSKLSQQNVYNELQQMIYFPKSLEREKYNMTPYFALLLSNKKPEQFKFGDDPNSTLSEFVRKSNGKFIFSNLYEIFIDPKENVSKENLQKIFNELFDQLRFIVNVLFIDLEFLETLLKKTNVDKDYLHEYLISIFALSFISAKSDECKNCDHINNTPYKHFNLVIKSRAENNSIFPEFLDWLRLKDNSLQFFDIPITSEKIIHDVLNEIKERFQSKSQEEAMYAAADGIANKYTQIMNLNEEAMYAAADHIANKYTQILNLQKISRTLLADSIFEKSLNLDIAKNHESDA